MRLDSIDREGASHFTQRAASFNVTTGLLEMPQLPALGASHGHDAWLPRKARIPRSARSWLPQSLSIPACCDIGAEAHLFRRSSRSDSALLLAGPQERD